jgi:hypothetical protein
MTESPFTLLTLIVGPAVLTNACSVLALNTANRYGRAFDRAREVSRELAHLAAPHSGRDDEVASLYALLERTLVRAALLLRAQTAFFGAIGIFVLSALVSLVGAAVSFESPALSPTLVALSLAVGIFATGCLVFGCVLTVRETRLALASLREEQRLLSKRYPRSVS